MPSTRPPRSAGTTVLPDALRRPPRYPAFPPGPEESPADIKALQAGQARRVGCYLRAASGPYPRNCKRGTLEVGGHTATWKRVGGRRSGRLVIDVRGMSVMEARPAGHREQRFGSPANIHLFALVRCAAPAGSLDLIVPTADVPLITWFFGGQPDIPASALLDYVVRPGPRKLINRKRAWIAFAAGCGLMTGPLVAAAIVPSLDGLWTRSVYGIGCLLFVKGILNIVRARRQERREEV